MTTRLVLAGGGHAHLAVLEALAARPRSDFDAVLVTPQRVTTYSGMLPGWMAGHYALDELQIDVGALAGRAGVRLELGAVAALDAERNAVVTADGKRIAYDLLSLDVGGEPDSARFAALGARAVSIRPLEAFVERWQDFIAMAAAGARARVVVIGAGAAGVELALAARRALQYAGGSGADAQRDAGARAVEVSLVDPAPMLLRGLARGAARRVEQLLTRRGIVTHRAEAHAQTNGLCLEGGTVVPVDLAIIATGSRPPRWLRASGIELDADGYVVVRGDHRSRSHANVFAAGDVCARVDQPLAHSGVHAVKAGPVLARNLLAALDTQPLARYEPRHRTLYLLSLGDRRAVMSWGGVSTEGEWVWRWKRALDRRFVRRHTVQGDGPQRP